MSVESQKAKGFFFQLSTFNFQHLQQLLRKEKDGASRLNHFQADSLNAFIPRFAGVEGFFVFGLRLRPRPRPRPRKKFAGRFGSIEDEDEDEDEDEFTSALVFQQ